MNGMAQEWLARALEDLKTVEKLLGDEGLANVAAFHSQQCIEKCFKGVIEASGQSVPRVHDLIRLAGIVAETLTIPVDEDTLIELSTVYLGCRYPAATGFLPSGKPDNEAVERFYRTARQIYKSVAE